MPSVLDVYNATNNATQDSNKLFANLLQNSIGNVSGAIAESSKINQGIMQSAIQGQQLVLDSWYKEQELKKQSASLDIAAKNLDLRNKEYMLTYQQRQDALDEKNREFNERIKQQTQAEQSKSTIGLLNVSLAGLKDKANTIKYALDTDSAQLNKIMGVKDDPLAPLMMDDSQAIQYKNLVPQLQDRIAKHTAELQRIGGNMDIITGTAGYLANGLIKPEDAVKVLSGSMPPSALHPDSYTLHTGDPITNEDHSGLETGSEVNNNITSSTFDTGIQSNTEETGQENGNPYTAKPQVVKMNTQQVLGAIDTALSRVKGGAQDEERVWPTIQSFIDKRADTQAQIDLQNARKGYEKQFAGQWFDEGANPSSANQKLEKIDATSLRNYKRIGGTDTALNELRNRFVDLGKQVQDGSIIKNPAISLPSSLGSKFTFDDKGNFTGNVTQLDKQIVRNNIISSLFDPQVNTKKVDEFGRPTIDAPINNDASVNIDSSGNKVIKFQRDQTLPQEPDETTGAFAIESLKTDLKAKNEANSVLYKQGTSGEIDDNKIANTLRRLPIEAILTPEEIRKNSTYVSSESGFGSGYSPDRKKISQLRDEKIKQLISSGDYDKISNILFNHYRDKEQKPQGVISQIGSLIFGG